MVMIATSLTLFSVDMKEVSARPCVKRIHFAPVVLMSKFYALDSNKGSYNMLKLGGRITGSAIKEGVQNYYKK